MAHDVFISYSSRDLPLAESVCAALERAGVRCWYAPRDVFPGTNYEEAIVDAITDCRLVLLLLSSNSNKSAHVRREIQNACAEEAARPVLPVRVEAVELNKALKYYLGSVQWFDASAPPFDSHLPRLVAHLQARLSHPASEDEQQRATTPTPARPQTPKEQPVEPRFNLGLAGLFSDCDPAALASHPAPREKPAEAASNAPRADWPGFLSAPRWTLAVVVASLALLVGGAAAVSRRIHDPAPLADHLYLSLVIGLFVAAEGVVTYLYARRKRSGRLILCIPFLGAIVAILIGWNSYYVKADISGRVSDGSNYELIKGARVELRDREGVLIRQAETTQLGWYRFSGLEPGSYQLRVISSPSHLGHDETVRITSKGVQEDIVLVPRP